MWRDWRRWAVPAAATFLLLVVAVRACAPVRFALFGGSRTTVSHASVVERVRAVAKLVSTEATVRDVVVFENTRYGSTKKSLVVVTGKVLVGFDLEKDAEVRIDHARKRIAITLPPAQVLAVDVGDMRTYDEQRGLWNPFTPADRDRIYREARSHLVTAVLQMGSKEHAAESARRLLGAMFSADGYLTDVTVGSSPLLQPQPSDSGD